MALSTRTKFQLGILIRSTISATQKFRENILESSRNVSETTPRNAFTTFYAFDSCQGYPEYFQEPHWKSTGLPEITWQLCFIFIWTKAVWLFCSKQCGRFGSAPTQWGRSGCGCFGMWSFWPNPAPTVYVLDCMNMRLRNGLQKQC